VKETCLSGSPNRPNVLEGVLSIWRKEPKRKLLREPCQSSGGQGSEGISPRSVRAEVKAPEKNTKGLHWDFPAERLPAAAGDLT